jgi:hypothetical protein
MLAQAIWKGKYFFVMKQFPKIGSNYGQFHGEFTVNATQDKIPKLPPAKF